MQNGHLTTSNFPINGNYQPPNQNQKFIGKNQQIHANGHISNSMKRKNGPENGHIEKMSPNRPISSQNNQTTRVPDNSSNDKISSSINNNNNNENLILKEKPLIALLDGKNCQIEMAHLKDIANVAFCNASSISEIHDKVQKEAFAVIIHNDSRAINFNKKILKKFDKLQLIIKIGENTDNIDLKAAAAKNIVVLNVPEVSGVSENIANSTIEMILGLYKQSEQINQDKFKYHNKIIQNNLQDNINSNKILTIEDIVEASPCSRRISSGEVLGIIGLGQVGSLVAVRAKAFGFRVMAYDPYIQKRLGTILGVEMCDSLEDLLKKSTCLTIHCTLTENTVNLISKKSLKPFLDNKKLPPFLINTSSSRMIDLSAVLNALNNKQLAGYATDVDDFKKIVQILKKEENKTTKAAEKEKSTREPLEQRIKSMNLICNPNNSWLTSDLFSEMRQKATNSLREIILSAMSTGLLKIPGAKAHVIDFSKITTGCVNQEFFEYKIKDNKVIIGTENQDNNLHNNIENSATSSFTENINSVSFIAPSPAVSAVSAPSPAGPPKSKMVKLDQVPIEQPVMSSIQNQIKLPNPNNSLPSTTNNNNNSAILTTHNTLGNDLGVANNLTSLLHNNNPNAMNEQLIAAQEQLNLQLKMQNVQNMNGLGPLNGQISQLPVSTTNGLANQNMNIVHSQANGYFNNNGNQIAMDNFNLLNQGQMNLGSFR